ncbi:DUF647 domain-containing protein [Phlyctema vagabunda]|uniref:DUF647 domain-containing protein n=1 Tax=Phlyctema vagabunda TaxID=108571 RepID=A0ABR4PWK6_9HELO
MGRIATILFAHRLGTSLEPECKMYRLLADIFNDSAMILDCLSPALPKSSRVLLLSFSSVLRSLCGVAAGSSKASLSAHFAMQGNLGELNAKDSSQETVISLLGMLAGSLVVSHISTQWATWTAMIALLAIHLGTNYLAVRAVSMRTLNRQRANLLFSHILAQAAFTGFLADNAAPRGLGILTPDAVSLQERVFERDGVLRWKGGGILGYCRLGVDLQTILNQLDRPHEKTNSRKASLVRLVGLYKDEGYILWYDSLKRTYLIVLKHDATTTVQLRAWMHALYSAKQGIPPALEAEAFFDHFQRTLTDIHTIVEKNKLFARLELAGWDLDIGAMETRSGTRILLRKEESLVSQLK